MNINNKNNLELNQTPKTWNRATGLATQAVSNSEFPSSPIETPRVDISVRANLDPAV
jgi:hypothetical protein